MGTYNQIKYHRQTILNEFGVDAQKKLYNAKVLVVGAGGLGCPALLYLAAAGINTIGIADGDKVELSNIHRQVLFGENDIGMLKAESAAEKLKSMHPGINILCYNYFLNSSNALDVIAQYDLVIDGSDNFSTKYMINDACALLNKPIIYGAVLKFEGQISVFNISSDSNTEKITYRDLFPSPPQNSMSCIDVGVLGVIPGIIGTMQACEAIKVITGIGETLSGKLISYNGLTNDFTEFKIVKRNNVQSPDTIYEFLKYDYLIKCEMRDSPDEITSGYFNTIKSLSSTLNIDVREKYEYPKEYDFPVMQIPFSELKKNNFTTNKNQRIVLFCQTGMRSNEAVKILKKKLPDIKIFSLQGGMNAYHSKNIPDE